MARPKTPFRFKQFSVDDSNCSMKVGTDGVLLGAWADVTNSNRMLDIGTGSGVIAMMLAQRSASTTQIDAVEMEEADANQAKENFTKSPWCTKLTVIHSSIQEFKPSQGYDLIVSNPPFFINSFLPPSKNRSSARHTQTLDYTDLLKATNELLTKAGRFCVVLPTQEGHTFQAMAKTVGLHLTRATAFFSKRAKPQERWLFEFSYQDVPTRRDDLILYDDRGNWSTEYKELTSDFYLDKH